MVVKLSGLVVGVSAENKSCGQSSPVHRQTRGRMPRMLHAGTRDEVTQAAGWIRDRTKIFC